jgi:hypothetical protein
MFVYITLLSIAENKERQTVISQKNEQHGICYKAAMTQLKYYSPAICLEGLMKTTKSSATMVDCRDDK